MKKTRTRVLAAALLLGILAGCSANKEPEEPISIIEPIPEDDPYLKPQKEEAATPTPAQEKTAAVEEKEESDACPVLEG